MKTFTMQVEELEQDGKVYRLCTFQDDVALCYEAYMAEYEYGDNGDAETGPRPYRDLGSFRQIDGGYGHATLLDLIERWKYEVDPRDAEMCPGCGCRPGDGVTATCYHPDGCGYHKTQEFVHNRDAKHG